MTELYLYQIIHLHNRTPRRLDAHIELLDAAAQYCFGIGYAPNPSQLAQRISLLAAREGLPADRSGFVRLELTADGTERLLWAGISLYDGYALRSLAPKAATLEYTPLLADYPTSAREAAAQLARRRVELAGASVAVRCNGEGALCSADEAPLFAVHERVVYTSPTGRSVERELAIDAILKAGLELVETPIERRSLPHFDELFYADHRGITALSTCDAHPYMALIAERVAAAMEALFGKV